MKSLFLVFSFLTCSTVFACSELIGDYQISDLIRLCKTQEERMPGRDEDIDWYLPEHTYRGNEYMSGYIASDTILSVATLDSCKTLEITYQPVTIERGTHTKIFKTTYVNKEMLASSSDSDGLKKLKLSLKNGDLRLVSTYGKNSKRLVLDCVFRRVN